MRSTSSAVVFVVTLCAAQAANAIVIDDFTVGPILLERNAGVAVSQIQTGLDPAHVLGGRREIVLGQNYDNGQVLEINTLESRMTLSAAPSPALAGLDLTYGSRTNPLGVDLTAEGHDRLVLDFDVMEGCCNTFIVTSLAGNVLSTDFVELRNYFNGKVAQVPFSEFTGVDLTNVASVELDFGRYRGLVLQSIYTIPEPASAGLLIVMAAYVTGARLHCARLRE